MTYDEELKADLEMFVMTPGTCSVDQVIRVKGWYENFKKQLEIFISSHGYNPIGHSVDMKISNCDWYIKYLSEKGK